MIRIQQVLILFLLFNLRAAAQKDTVAIRFSRTISENELRTHLFILSDSSMQGREMGSPGQKRAAAYIARSLQSLQLAPVAAQPGGGDEYYQQFSIPRTEKNKVEIQIGSYRPEWLTDFFCAVPLADTMLLSNQVVFMGYGLDEKKYSDFRDLPAGALKGKVVVVFPGVPRKKNGKYLLGDKVNDAVANPQEGMNIKVENVMKYEPAAVLVVEEHYSIAAMKSRLGLNDGRSRAGIPEIHISQAFADSLLGMESHAYRQGLLQRKPQRPLTQDMVSFIKMNSAIPNAWSENVIGYIEGDDLKDELIVISAHYDHLGMNEKGIYYGANDNASGTAAVLEIADAFMQAKKAGKGPRRSILFMLMSGEEKGLLGSEYYVENPVFPLERTMANLNVDMIGRVDSLHTDPDYIYLIGADRLSRELHDISESTNKLYTGLKLDYKFNAPEDPNRFYYRSDHYNFAKNGVPVIFYFNGMHADYHKPTDTPEKVDTTYMLKVSHLIFFTAWKLANLDHRLQLKPE